MGFESCTVLHSLSGRLNGSSMHSHRGGGGGGGGGVDAEVQEEEEEEEEEGEEEGVEDELRVLCRATPGEFRR